MTNTHINVGGHKITTNKVGEVHTVTSGFSNNYSGTINWCVINGICYVNVAVKSTTAYSGEQNIYAALPKAKLGYQYYRGIEGADYVYVQRITDASALVSGPYSTANRTMIVSCIYPVADDWVES